MDYVCFYFQPFLKAGRYSVGVYGDPHMLTYGSYQLQTCEINGLRDFIVNKFFRISAISDYVRPGQRGTSLTQVCVFEVLMNFGMLVGC